MKPEQAKEIAVKVFGPGSTVVREGSWCRVLDPTGKEVGKGESWKSALQMACQPIIAAEAAKRREHEESLNKERELFGDFLTALYHAFKAGKALEFLNAAAPEPDPSQLEFCFAENHNHEVPARGCATPEPRKPLVTLG